MSEDKKELARAGTIEITSKEGKAFLEKNLTQWKKPMLMEQFAEDDKTAASASSEKKAACGKKRGKAAKCGSAAKKAKISKASTMAVTAKEGAELLGDEKLGDTRLMTKAKPKPTPAAKRTNTMNRVLEEAKAVCGTINSSEGRRLRKRPAPAAASPRKTPVKKAGTMVKTAKEGKAFLKRGCRKSGKAAS